MEDIAGFFVGGIALVTIFLGLPWLIFHYVTKWKSQATITREDEQLLDELHEMARRLDDRLCSIERIMNAENPAWRSVGCDPLAEALEGRGAGRSALGSALGASEPDSTVTNQPRRIGQ
jgi:phage shock protein B